MAHVSRLSDLVRGGVAGESIQEGTAVVMTQSGVRNELPVLMKAGANATGNVFVIMASPDNFARPTLEGMYTAGSTTTIDAQSNTGWSNPVESLTYYKVGKSTLWNPTIVSGELAQAHRGGTYAVLSGTYVDSADIKVPGNKIAVAADGQWTYTSGANAVGFVEEFDADRTVLYITLHQ